MSGIESSPGVICPGRIDDALDQRNAAAAWELQVKRVAGNFLNVLTEKDAEWLEWGLEEAARELPREAS